jgi:hypothetical protein
MKLTTRLFSVVTILATLVLFVPATFVAAAAQPTYDSAVVDGSYGEWNLVDDHFADMIKAWGNGGQTQVLADLYLRYDCSTETLYALVLSDYQVQVDTTAWIAVGAINTKVTFSSFAWIYDNGTAIGWEASFPLAAQQDYTIWAHTNVWESGTWQTAGTNKNDGTPITIYCAPDPTAVVLASFEAASAVNGIRLSWETASEFDVLGFNLYRTEAPDGQRIQLNKDLIAAQSLGSSTGASYEFVDETALPRKTYYYWLQDLDLRGGSNYHGPVEAQVELSRLLRPVRPRLIAAPPSLGTR